MNRIYSLSGARGARAATSRYNIHLLHLACGARLMTDLSYQKGLFWRSFFLDRTIRTDRDVSYTM